jgi:hypothetical protein
MYGQAKNSPSQDGRKIRAAASPSIRPTAPAMRMARSRVNPSRRVVREALMARLE